MCVRHRLRDCLPEHGDDVSVPASLHDWVELWFGPTPRQPDAAALVKPLLRFNHVPAEPWVDRGVDVLVVENQGVWLWGRTDAGDFVERENDDDGAWRPSRRTRRSSGYTTQRTRPSGPCPRTAAHFSWIGPRSHSLKAQPLLSPAASGHGRVVSGCGTDPGRWP